MATENEENTEATKKNAWKHLGISSHHSKKIHDSSKNQHAENLGYKHAHSHAHAHTHTHSRKSAHAHIRR